MASKTQGTRVQIETALGANKTITAITAADPPVVTSASHGLANGTVVKITGVVGMVQVNNRAFVVAATATNTFELKGVKGATYTAYTSGGVANAATLADIGEVTNVSGLDGQADDIDVTNLRSIAKETLIGLPDPGTLSMDVTLNNTDTGQLAVRAAQETGVPKVFAILLTDSTIGALVAGVKQFTFNSQGNEAYRGTIQLKLTTKQTDFA